MDHDKSRLVNNIIGKTIFVVFIEFLFKVLSTIDYFTIHFSSYKFKIFSSIIAVDILIY